MDRKKVDSIWLWISIISYLILSLTFLFMPLDQSLKTNDTSWFSIMIGVCFWLFLLIGVVTQVVLSKRRKDWYRKHRIKISDNNKKHKMGLISFFQNLPAMIADISFAVFLMSFIIAVILTSGMGYGCYIFLSLTVFAFCILNGKLFFHVFMQDQLLKILDKKKTDINIRKGDHK